MTRRSFLHCRSMMDWYELGGMCNECLSPIDRRLRGDGWMVSMSNDGQQATEVVMHFFTTPTFRLCIEAV